VTARFEHLSRSCRTDFPARQMRTTDLFIHFNRPRRGAVGLRAGGRFITGAAPIVQDHFRLGMPATNACFQGKHVARHAPAHRPVTINRPKTRVRKNRNSYGNLSDLARTKSNDSGRHLANCGNQPRQPAVPRRHAGKAIRWRQMATSREKTRKNSRAAFRGVLYGRAQPLAATKIRKQHHEEF